MAVSFPISFVKFLRKAIFLEWRFTPCKVEQPLRDLELQVKEVQKD